MYRAISPSSRLGEDVVALVVVGLGMRHAARRGLVSLHGRYTGRVDLRTALLLVLRGMGLRCGWRRSTRTTADGYAAPVVPSRSRRVRAGPCTESVAAASASGESPCRPIRPRADLSLSRVAAPHTRSSWASRSSSPRDLFREEDLRRARLETPTATPASWGSCPGKPLKKLVRQRRRRPRRAVDPLATRLLRERLETEVLLFRRCARP